MHFPIWYGLSALVWALFLLVVLALLIIGLVWIVRGAAALRGLLAPGVRVWLYDLASALLMLATGYGLVKGNLADLWLVVLAGLFHVARSNVPNAPDAQGSNSGDAIAQAVTQALAKSVPVLAKTMATTTANPDLSSTPVAPTGA